MKETIYYILSAITGGIVAEVNKPVNEQNRTFSHIFAVGSTSVVIGIVFGLGAEYLTGSVKLSIAISALAGVGGFSSLTWITTLCKRLLNDKGLKSPKKD